jgi:phage-related minor tail protein
VTDVDSAATAAAMTDLHLDVYDTRDGPWNPEHGDVEIPEDWEFPPAGSAFLTRTVKAAGRYWLSWQPRSRHRAHRRLLGLWAPVEAIRDAENRAKQTADKRAAARTVNARSRARREEQYQERLQESVLAFLDFAREHAALAEQIATETAAHAAVVGSGRVGRTQLLSLEDKARLAARAHIRHRYTRYEDELTDLPFEAWDEDELYREIKGAAHEAVDDFLDEHRAQ